MLNDINPYLIPAPGKQKQMEFRVGEIIGGVEKEEQEEEQEETEDKSEEC